MRDAHELEQAVGIDHYVSDSDGTGGQLRAQPADFRVRELETVDPAPLDTDPGSYPALLCRVTLTGWDTNDFASRLSDALGISRERVSWAGTKDKHAVTTQLFTIRNSTPDQLPDIRDTEIEAVGRLGRPLSFGDLAGNSFRIRLSDTVPDARDRIETIINELRTFAGSGAADSAEPGENPQADFSTAGVGVAADTEPATDTGVAVDGADSEVDSDTTARVGVPNYFGQQRFGSYRPVTHEVGLAVLRGDWRGAVRAYAANPSEAEPEESREARTFVAEQFDAKNPDWEACLSRLPRQLGFERSMIHQLAADDSPADPDYRAALETVPENLQRLFVNAAQSFLFNQILSARLDRGLPFATPVEGDIVCFADNEAPPGLHAPDTDRLQPVTADRVKIVTRHCRRGRAFVTAPLIGTDTELAEGKPGEIERVVLEEAGLSPESFALPDSWASTGTRRAVLLVTDLAHGPGPTVQFALQSGSYATVVLRELLKIAPTEL